MKALSQTPSTPPSPLAPLAPLAPPRTVIEPSRGWIPVDLGELYRYRELLYFLVWRDVKVRYKQTLLGAAWAVLQPLLTMAIFSIVLGRLAKLPTDGIPYPLFAFTALVPWQLFAYGVGQASNSLVANSNLVRKVYFPRLLLPVASALSGVVDMALALGVLFLLMLYYGAVPSSAALWLPLFTLLALATALAIGLWLSALNARFRDIRHTVPFLLQTWLFATPIAYSSSLVPESWRTIYALNPMVGVVEGFRWALIGSGQPPGPMVLVSASVTLALLVSGIFYFRRMERSLADVV